MDLNTIAEIAHPKDDHAIDWREGDAWLAGGTWLFSEPQPHLRRLIDLRRARLAAIDRTRTASRDCRHL